MRKKRVCVFTTAYNEEKNILHLLERIPTDYEIIVVDDGSTDNTAKLSLAFGAKVVRHPINLGQGMTVITEFKLACKLQDIDFMVHVDADGQHDPREIPKFIAKMDETDADIVIGSRRLGTNYASAPFFRRTFLPLYTGIVNRLTGYCMTDSMCGFRAFRISSIKRVENILEDMLEPEYLAAEMFMRFSRAGLKVVEIPIDLQDRMSGSSYKGFLRYGLGILKACLRTFVDRNYRLQQISCPYPSGETNTPHSSESD